MEVSNRSNKTIQVINQYFDELILSLCSVYEKKCSIFPTAGDDFNYNDFLASFTDLSDIEKTNDKRLKLLKYFFIGLEDTVNVNSTTVKFELQNSIYEIRVTYFLIKRDAIPIIFIKGNFNRFLLSLLYIEVFHAFLNQEIYVNSILLVNLKNSSDKTLNEKEESLDLYLLSESNEKSLFKRKRATLRNCFKENLSFTKKELVLAKQYKDASINKLIDLKPCKACVFADNCLNKVSS